MIAALKSCIVVAVKNQGETKMHSKHTNIHKYTHTRTHTHRHTHTNTHTHTHTNTYTHSQTKMAPRA